MYGTGDIVNTALLWSVGLPSVSEILTKHVVEGAFGIVQECVPSSGVLAITSVQFEPLFVEYSIRTFPLVSLDVHIMS
jgi:hypothetical protein